MNIFQNIIPSETDVNDIAANSFGKLQPVKFLLFYKIVPRLLDAAGK